MIYIFGDSHANFNFKNMPYKHVNLYENSITMHRIGRDGIFKFDPSYNTLDSIFIMAYGEVDCRCHIGKEVRNGRLFKEVCSTLVDAYIEKIKKHIPVFKKIILCSIVPPTSNKHLVYPEGFPFPLLGEDLERIGNTKYVNSLLKEACLLNGYEFLDIYEHYAELDGTLKYESSDKIVHIIDNEYILASVGKLISP